MRKTKLVKNLKPGDEIVVVDDPRIGFLAVKVTAIARSFGGVCRRLSTMPIGQPYRIEYDGLHYGANDRVVLF